MSISYLRQGTLPPSELLLLVEGCEGGPLVCGEAPGVGSADVCSPPPPPPSGDSKSFSSYCIRTSSNCVRQHTRVHINTFGEVKIYKLEERLSLDRSTKLL